jgi:toxin ParE1/3/4
VRRYKISREAEADLIRIYQWGVRQYGTEKADRYLAMFFERFEEIAEQPSLYQAVDHIRKGYRRSVCGIDSIYYRINGGVVEIMAILGRQETEALP